MAKAKKHSENSAGKLIRYLKGLLTRQERHAYEKAMMKDAFEEDAFDGLSGLSAEELEADLRQLDGRIQDRFVAKQSRKGLLPYFLAAAVLVLAVGTTIYIIQRSVDTPQTQQQIAQSLESPSEERIEKQRSYDSMLVQPSPKGETKLSPTTAKKMGKPTTTQVENDKSEEGIKQFNDSEFQEEIMTEDLEEVVVIGYGVQKKADLNGSVSSVDEEEMISPSHAEQALQNRAAGVSISSGSDQVAESEINVMTYDDEIIGDERIIKGVVLADSDGLPIPGVNVMLSGTTKGTITDLDGKFEMSVPIGGKSIIAFNFIGYLAEEIVIADENEINLAMTEDVTSLDEVVVVGYGSSKKTNLTGSISRISSEDISPGSANSGPVHIKPSPVCGNGEYREYITENIKYDDLPSFRKAVTVRLEFSVGPQGDVFNIRVRKSGGNAFDQEAIRLLTEGPGWLAGTMDGRAIQDETTYKFKFEPEK